MLTSDDKSFIDVIELALDFNLYIPEEYLQKYYNLIESEVKQDEP